MVLANSNTAPTDAVARAALDPALGVRPDHGAATAGVDPAHLSALLPPVVGPVAAALAESGTEAAVVAYGRLASAEPATIDLDDERFVDGVWGRSNCTAPTWSGPSFGCGPLSPQAWTMMGWAHTAMMDSARGRLALS